MKQVSFNYYKFIRELYSIFVWNIVSTVLSLVKPKYWKLDIISVIFVCSLRTRNYMHAWVYSTLSRHKCTNSTVHDLCVDYKVAQFWANISFNLRLFRFWVNSKHRPSRFNTCGNLIWYHFRCSICNLVNVDDKKLDYLNGNWATHS